jgi:uncharacterized protein YllA (UPF0747 family)
MSSMTQKAESDCSYPESDNVDLKSQILNVYERLTTIVKEEVDLRRDLEDLFDKQEAEAIEELKKAERNIELIRSERDRMRRQLEQDGLRFEVRNSDLTYRLHALNNAHMHLISLLEHSRP